jgi:uncharacterized membrane protein YhhN
MPETLPIALPIAPLLLSLIAVIGLVISDQREYRPGRYLFKPLAAAAFIWLALSLGALDSEYGRWMLWALGFCMIGDLFLMPNNERSFLLGLVAFLLGHLLFAVAFLQLPVNLTGVVFTIAPALFLLIFVRSWLLPKVGTDMKIPVIAYVLVITAMLFAAGATLGQPGAALIIAGALSFAISDLAVSRQQFVQPSHWNGLWGTPLYFAAQMMLATTVGFY